MPLEYRSVLPDGMVWDAREHNGIATLVLEQYGFKKDLSDFVAPGFRLVTPSFFKRTDSVKLPRATEERVGNWLVNHDQDLVMIGDVRELRDLFVFFHEAGHTFQKEKDEILKKEVREAALRGDRFEAEALMLRISFLERDASAYALKAIKKLRDEYHIDLLSLFEKDELKNLIYGALVDYRYSSEILYRKLLTFWEGEGVSEEKIETILRTEMKKLFDKERLKH